MSAKASDANDRIDKFKNAFDLFQGHHLAIVDFLHLFGDYATDQAPHKGRSLLQPAQTSNIVCQALGLRKKAFYEFAPAHIAQQILRIIFSLQVPFSSFPVFQAKLAHMTLLPKIEEETGFHFLPWLSEPPEPACSN
jgi:hypothetical protein